MKKFWWLLAVLALVACGGISEDELTQQEEYFRALLAEKEAEIASLQESNINLHLTNEHLLEQIEHEATGDEARVLDAGRTWWRDWWGWQQNQPFGEGFAMRIYTHPMAEYDFENFYEAEISPENWEERIMAAMQAHTGIIIDDMWLEETRLVVDLNSEDAVRFNWGSSGGYFLTRALIDSLVTIPNVTEIVVLVGGKRGLHADHFSFAQIFMIGSDGQWQRGN